VKNKQEQTRCCKEFVDEKIPFKKPWSNDVTGGRKKNKI
jgi:hypothetical protein